MHGVFLIPLACFALAVLVVAIVQVSKIREIEIEVAERIHRELMEHRRQMQELDLKLERAKRG